MPKSQEIAESDLPEIITASELSKWLGISEKSLSQDRYLGQGLPYVKIGKRVRYMRDDVLAYLHANRVQIGKSA